MKSLVFILCLLALSLVASDGAPTEEEASFESPEAEMEENVEMERAVDDNLDEILEGLGDEALHVEKKVRKHRRRGTTIEQRSSDPLISIILIEFKHYNHLHAFGVK